MRRLQIDDQTYQALTARAAARGLSLAEWLRAEAIPPGDDSESAPAADRGSREWLHWFASLHRGVKGRVDDSRESIYD
jgi:hypothetical protein